MKRFMGIMLTSVVYACTMISISVSAYAPNGIKNNGLGGIYIDINSAPFTTFQGYSYGGNAYTPTGCAWYASARVNQLTGKGNVIRSAFNWWNNCESYGFTRSSTPVEGSIICVADGTSSNSGQHVAILEKIDGTTAYISEGGYNSAGSAYGYCIIRTVSVSNIASQYASSDFGGYTNFLGYVCFNGSSPAPPADLGLAFEGILLQKSAWKPIINEADNAQVGTERGNINERWWFERQGDGSYTIESLSNNKFLDAYGGFSDNGTNVQLFNWNDTDSQKWYIYECGDGYSISPKYNTNLCFDCVNGSTDNGTNLQLWESNSTNAQIFSIYKCGLKKKINIGTNFEAAILQKSAWITLNNSNDNVQLNNEGGNISERWWFARQNDGSYRIENLYNNKYMDADSLGTTNGTNVHLYVDNDCDAQRWFIYPSGDGYSISPKYSADICLDCESGSTADGANIQLWECNNTDAQKFAIYKFREYKVQNLGTDFYSIILRKDIQKPVAIYDDKYIKLDTDDGSSRFVYRFNRNYDGTYTITSAHNGDVLDVDGNADTNGQKIHTWENLNADNQKWYIYYYDGGYIMQPKFSSTKVLDVTSGSSDNGTPLQIWEQNNTTSQIFTIYDSQEINLKAPSLSVVASQADTETVFSWDSSYGRKNYILSVWKDAVNGSPVFTETTEDTQLRVKLPAGKYVASVSSANALQSLSSATVTFEVSEYQQPDLLIFSLTQHDGYVEITNESNDQYTPTIIVAKYENGRLVDLSSASITFAVGEKRSISTGSGEYKVFVWNSLKDMVPLAYPT